MPASRAGLASRTIPFAGLILALVVLSLTSIYDLDFGFYLAVGRAMLDGSYAGREFYLPLLPPETPFASLWLLAAPVFALVWGVAGPAGLVLLKAGCVAGGFGMLALAAVRRGASAAVACLIVGIAACAVSSRFVERPGLFSILLIGAAHLLLSSGKERIGPARMVGIWTLFLCWSFLHAEWFLGLFLLGGLVMGSRESMSRKALLLAPALVLPALAYALLHPAGLRAMISPFAFLGGADSVVTPDEYRTQVWRVMWPAIPVLLAVITSCIWLIRKGRAWEALAPAALALLSVAVPRAALPAVLAGLPFLAEFASSNAPLRRLSDRTSAPPIVALAVASLSAATLALTPWMHPGLGLDPRLDTRGVGSVLDRIPKVEGPVLAEFGWSSVLLSQPGVVRQGIVMDGRQEAYSAAYVRGVYEPCFADGDPNWAAHLDKLGIAFYYEPFGSRAPMAAHIQRGLGWDLVAWDDSGRLFARPGIAERHRLTTYIFDPDRIDELASAPASVLLAAMEEFRSHSQDLRIDGFPARRAFIVHAQVAMALGDLHAAEESLSEAHRERGGATVALRETERVLRELRQKAQ